MNKNSDISGNYIMKSNFQSDFILNNNIIFNNKSLAKLAINNKKLSVKEFIEKTEYKLEKSYVDKFWSNIQNDKHIIIDDGIIKWLGYTGKIKYAKHNLINFMNNHNITYILENYDYFQGCENSHHTYFENNDIKYMKQRNYIIVDIDNFKQICMLVNTQKGKQIRNYYIQLEKLFKNYIKYQKLCYEYKYKSTEKENKELKSTLHLCNDEISKLKKIKNKNESVYIVSSDLYSKQDLYKIGKAKNIKSRISSLNTSHTLKDKMKKIKEYKVFNSKIAEDRVKFILDSIRDSLKREFYKEKIENLDKIVNLICQNLNKECNILNDLVDGKNIINISIPITNNIYNNDISGNNNVINNNPPPIISNEDKALYWIKKNCKETIKIKEIMEEFKKNNPNVRHSNNFIANLLKEADYKKIHTHKGNFWKKKR